MRIRTATARCGVIALALALAPIAARAAADAKPEGDLARLQGSWTAKVGPEKNIPLVLTIDGEKATVTFTRPDDTEVKITGKIKVDASKSPRQLDWTEFTGPGGNAVEDNLAIYELDGDTLRVCSGGPGNERPTKFEAGEDGPRLNTFHRQAKADKDKDKDKDSK